MITTLNRRQFTLGALGAGSALCATSLGLYSSAQTVSAATSSSSGASYTSVDPELVPWLKAHPPVSVEQLLAAKKMAIPAPLPPPAPQPIERHIPGLTGDPEVKVLIIDPHPESKGKPGFLYIHGGGFVVGSAAWRVPYAQRIAQSCDCVVISVDYRLAPETHFPGSLQDNYAALHWVYINADSLGIDRTRIAVGGESSGGGHAAALAIHARDVGEVPIVLQLLIYPMLDDRTGSSRPVPPHVGEFVWPVQTNRFGWTALLGVPAGSTRVPANSVPARVENLAGLPPAFIAVGSIDLFVDEDVEYARRLIDFAVPTELHVVLGAYHGFDLDAPKAAVSQRFTQLWMSALRRALGTA